MTKGRREREFWLAERGPTAESPCPRAGIYDPLALQGRKKNRANKRVKKQEQAADFPLGQGIEWNSALKSSSFNSVVSGDNLTQQMCFRADFALCNVQADDTVRLSRQPGASVGGSMTQRNETN